LVEDPMPPIDPHLPIVRQAVERVKFELMLVQAEHPDMTEREALREARRRCSKAMCAAAEALEPKPALRCPDVAPSPRVPVAEVT
jgi:hypothetical protein